MHTSSHANVLKINTKHVTYASPHVTHHPSYTPFPPNQQAPQRNESIIKFNGSKSRKPLLSIGQGLHCHNLFRVPLSPLQFDTHCCCYGFGGSNTVAGDHQPGVGTSRSCNASAEYRACYVGRVWRNSSDGVLLGLQLCDRTAPCWC